MAVTRGQLMRSRDNRLIAGVCGGIAEWLGWDATIVRIAYVVGSAVSAAFPGILVYLVLWLVMPLEPAKPTQTFGGPTGEAAEPGEPPLRRGGVGRETTERSADQGPPGGGI